MQNSYVKVKYMIWDGRSTKNDKVIIIFPSINLGGESMPLAPAATALGRDVFRRFPPFLLGGRCPFPGAPLGSAVASVNNLTPALSHREREIRWKKDCSGGHPRAAVEGLVVLVDIWY
jgi:hypothetical protein